MVRRLVSVASIGRRDTVLEIGSGYGMLTHELARRARRVIAIEIDSRLAQATRQRTESFSNVEVECIDFFDMPLPDSPYRVVANIPFNVTSAIMDRLTSSESPPLDCHLVVQQQAAERYIGRPKTTLASVLMHPWFDVEIADRLRRSDFTPRPSVDSVLLRIETRDRALVDAGSQHLFRDFVTFGFTAWQPDLRTAYSHVLTGNARREIEKSGIDLMRRPSEVHPGEWLTIFSLFARLVPVARQRRVEGAHKRLSQQQAKLEKSHRTRRRR